VVKTQQVSTSLKLSETVSVKVILLERGLTVESLAADCRISARSFRNQVAANFPSLRLRLVLEQVLALPIWSTLEDFNSRKELIARCGFDPLRRTTTQLYNYLAVKKIRGRSKTARTRKELTELLMQSALQPKTHKK
jgi:AraC-like DNA-binding protein